MTNQEIAKVLDHIAKILSIKGENPFKVRAYSKASQVIGSLPYQLSSLEDKAKITELPGIGQGIAKKLIELTETGKLDYYEDIKKSEYAPLTEFLDIPGMGPRHARLVYDELGINNLDELRRAAEQGRLRHLHGLGQKLESNILQGIRQVQRYKERYPLAFIYPRAQEILEQMKKVKQIEMITLAGSLRRMKETIADVDILASSNAPEKVMAAFVSLPQAKRIIAKGKTKSSIVTGEGFQVDLRVVPPESYGAASHYFTGSKAHNIKVRSLGMKKGLKINEYGVFRKERQIAGRTEEEIFNAVDLPYIPPELREDAGEVEAGLEGKLPDLVALQDIKGDLHVHSNWTDGNNSIEEMAVAARELGYEYLAICDHSLGLSVARGLTPERLTRQAGEISGLNKKLKDFRVLSGIEVDIKANGELDLAEDDLRSLDIVVAAVHSKFKLSEGEMTKRLIRAIENPVVHIIAHPTGRLIGKREPYPVDMDKVLDACKANGKVLELNAHPERLDLSDLNCRKAQDKGVLIAISTDAHADSQLELMKFGVATARRGWIEPRSVINTLPLSRLLTRLNR
ncbi:MAG: DNA polymerase/3'-5' exonuclease PolX [Deltaproteobacteria bacterium]|nr:DNA polymerase/3'-5' exonuclease PolX [Deltaproteobacteria bacterium]MBW2138895.1 DNA polymerase/3'-5' exonuclease PolX [Deltaproteobacteria bacterium]